MAFIVDALEVESSITGTGLSSLATDSAVFHKATASEFSALTHKITPVSGDVIPIEDSANTNSKAYATVGSLPFEPPITKNTAFNPNFETSTTNIKMDGAVSVGALGTVARADHIHATDTSREPTITKSTAFNPNFETSTANIKMDGAVSVGALGTVARADHIHATDTSREPTITKNTAFNPNFETSTANIKMDGAVSVGALSTIARADHIHASDTSRAIDTAVFHKATASEFSALTNKAVPTVNDFIPIEDAAAANAKAMVHVGDLPVATTGLNGYMSAADKTKLDAMVNLYEVTTGTQASTSTTYANVTELVTPTLDTGTYRFTCLLVFQSTATTTGIGFRMAASGATLTQCVGLWEIETAANGTAHTFQYSQMSATDNITSASVVATNTNYLTFGRGFITVSVAGAVAIQLRSETGTSVSIRAGSHLQIEKVA